LARWLLNQKSASDDREKMMISELWMSAPAQVVEGHPSQSRYAENDFKNHIYIVPVQEMTLSDTVNEEFRSHFQNLNGVDLSVRVLTKRF
jgi:hypothetical protein